MNVADMWSAFYAMVGKSASEEETTAKTPNPTDDEGYDERTALVLFYQGLADLKSMGFVKATRRRPDHIAKTKWLL